MTSKLFGMAAGITLFTLFTLSAPAADRHILKTQVPAAARSKMLGLLQATNQSGTSSLGLYNATEGYDLCTGWGTPAGTALIDAFVNLSGPVFVDFNYTGPASSGEDGPGSFDYPYKTMAQATAAVTTNGTIFIINGGSSSETMKISKPMKITAMNGTATVGD